MMSKQRTILLGIQYDGTEFSGWQIQPHQRSVQGEIEKALQKLHGTRVPLLTAGRTDAGVHAAGQAGSFRTTMDSLPAERFAAALNSMLPQDVRIQRSREVPDDFHATHHAVERSYRYYLYAGRFADPLLSRYRLRIPHLPDIRRLNRMAALLVGTHDFSGLASRKEGQTTTRTVYQAAFCPDAHGIYFAITGNGFLWKMVRTIVGTLLELAEAPDGEVRLQRILTGGDRTLAGKTAPPHGLVLYRVRYPHDEEDV